MGSYLQVMVMLRFTDTLLCAGYLHKVSLHSAENLMTAGNIAIVFAPNILRPPGDNVTQALIDCSAANMLVKIMVEDYDQLFGGVCSFSSQPPCIIPFLTS